MKKYLFWITELFIWFLILFLISGIIIFARYNHKKNFNVYQIFMPDVDGLIVGSPVRLMGIQIGHVNQLDIVGEDVYVRFIATEHDVKIPYGSTATVEFSGLGGSKSLELYPPTSEKNISNKFINVQSPKRIHESLGLLVDMFEKIADITYKIGNFMDKVDLIKSKQNHNINQPGQFDQFLNFLNDLLDKAQKQCDKFNNKLKKRKESKVNGQNSKQNQ